MVYERCPRCEINWKLTTEDICDICKRELMGETDELEDLVDICPYCEKNALEYGQEICESCQRKKNKLRMEN